VFLPMGGLGTTLMRLRIGLVGLGDAWQTRHAPGLRAMADRFEVRAICDQVRHRAEQAAEEFHAAAVDGYRALAAREDIDAVMVLSPQWYGALPILAACESRKAVYCAAGLDLAAEDAQLIRSRVDEAGIAFVAEFPRRQAPATIRLRELVATRLGEPQLLFCHQRSVVEPHPATTGWSQTHPATRYLLEQVDWCRYVADREATYVTGVLHRVENSRPEAEDYQMMSLDFSPQGAPGTGPIAQISCGRYVPSGWQEAISFRPLAALQVSCKRGIAFVDLPTTLVWFDEAGRHQESLDNERPVGEQLLTNFYRSITCLVRKTCDLEDACKAISIVQAARRSHQEGRRLEL
jgi:predicted dehydrogenase